MPFKSMFKCCTGIGRRRLDINNDIHHASQHNLVSHTAAMDGYDPLSENVYDNHTSIFRTVSTDSTPDFELLDQLSSQPRRSVQNEYAQPKIGNGNCMTDAPVIKKHQKGSKRVIGLRKFLFGDVVVWSPNEDPETQHDMAQWCGGEVARSDNVCSDIVDGDNELVDADVGLCACVKLKGCCNESCKYTVNKCDVSALHTGYDKHYEIVTPSITVENRSCMKKKGEKKWPSTKISKQSVKKTSSSRDLYCTSDQIFNSDIEENFNHSEVDLIATEKTIYDNVDAVIDIHVDKAGYSNSQVHCYADVDLNISEAKTDQCCRSDELVKSEDCILSLSIEGSVENPHMKEYAYTSTKINNSLNEIYNPDIENSTNVLPEKNNSLNEIDNPDIEISANTSPENNSLLMDRDIETTEIGSVIRKSVDLFNKPDISLIPKRSSSYSPRKRYTTSSFWKKNIAKRSKSLSLTEDPIEIDPNLSNEYHENNAFVADKTENLEKGGTCLINASQVVEHGTKNYIGNDDSGIDIFESDKNEVGVKDDSIETCSLQFDEFDDFINEFERKLLWLYSTQVITMNSLCSKPQIN